MTAAVPKQSDFIVRIPKRDTNKRISILKFNDSLNIDIGKWTTPGWLVRMFREDNREQAMASKIEQEYGEGSEFGKAVREEARRMKYGRQFREYHHDDQPWVLSIAESTGKERKFRSIREGGAGEHADYWVFFKSGEEFHAYKVDEWYHFLPFLTHRTLDIEQAEEQFRHRDRVLNPFALKTQIQQQLKVMEEEGEQIIKTTKSLKIKDEVSSESEGEKGDDEDDAPDNSRQKKKVKLGERVRKEKKQRVENPNEVAAYESDDGDDEGREFDYMSDSGSDSDRDNMTMEQKVDEAMVAVGDETGLKKQIESDSSDSDESSIDEATRKLLEASENNEQNDNKKYADIDEPDSSASDSDDPDKEINSAVLLPAKKVTDDRPQSSKGKKRMHESIVDTDAKRMKMERDDDLMPEPSAVKTVEDGLNEETVRRYLRRKPHTTKELLSKIKSKCGNMEKSEIVQKLAMILKHIGPHQFKQKQGKKDVLFFTLHNTIS